MTVFLYLPTLTLDQTYAEIEVMKMVMALTAPISGTVHYIKRPGAILEAGSTVARLHIVYYKFNVKFSDSLIRMFVN